jgi:hypothetical protein
MTGLGQAPNETDKLVARNSMWARLYRRSDVTFVYTIVQHINEIRYEAETEAELSCFRTGSNSGVISAEKLSSIHWVTYWQQPV